MQCIPPRSIERLVEQGAGGVIRSNLGIVRRAIWHNFATRGQAFKRQPLRPQLGAHDV